MEEFFQRCDVIEVCVNTDETYFLTKCIRGSTIGPQFAFMTEGSTIGPRFAFVTKNFSYETCKYDPTLQPVSTAKTCFLFNV